MTMMTRVLTIIASVFLLIIGYANDPLAAQNLELRSLKIYASFEGGQTGAVLYPSGKEVALKSGEVARLEIDRYSPVDGVRPVTVQLIAVVANRGPAAARDVEVRVAVFPKVAPLVFTDDFVDSGEDPSAADHFATEKAAAWFTPVLLLQKTIANIEAGDSAEIVFEGINLKGIIEGYAARRLWPTALRFEASVEPQGRQTSFRNNSKTRQFRIELPPY
jgi:hypothetical protein